LFFLPLISSTSPALYFCSRANKFYTYKDNEESTLSPHSKVVSYNVDGTPEDIVEIILPLDEIIPEDVQKINLVAINLPDGTYNTIKTWDADTDEADIEDHNDGTAALTYYYAADILGPALDQVYAVKPFDNVPHETGAQEIAKDRLFFADYKVGMDTPETTSLALAFTSAEAGPLADILELSPESAYFTYTDGDGSMVELPMPTQWVITDFTDEPTFISYTYTGTSFVNGEVSIYLEGSYIKDNINPFDFVIIVNGVNIADFTFGGTIQTGPSYTSFTQNFSAPVSISNGQIFSI